MKSGLRFGSRAISSLTSTLIVTAILIVGIGTGLTLLNANQPSLPNSVSSGSSQTSPNSSSQTASSFSTTIKDSSSSSSSLATSHMTQSSSSFASSSTTSSSFTQSNPKLANTTNPTMATGLATFYFRGLYWAFYREFNLNKGNTRSFYSTSPDGNRWSSAVLFSTNATVVSSSGEYVYYAYSEESSFNRSSIYFRRGILSSSGTIQWSTPADQIAYTAEADQNHSVSLNPTSVTNDSSGYPWIVSKEYIGPSPRTETPNGGCPNSGVGDAWCTSPYSIVLKSSSNDGTFKTQTGFPYVVGGGVIATSGYGPWASINSVSSTNGSVILATCAGFYGEGFNSTNYLRIWNGESWDGSIVKIPCGPVMSSLSDGDLIHMIFLNYPGTNETVYNYKTGLIQEFQVSNSPLASDGDVITLSNSTIYITSTDSLDHGIIIMSRQLNQNHWVQADHFNVTSNANSYVNLVASPLAVTLPNSEQIGLLYGIQDSAGDNGTGTWTLYFMLYSG